MKSSLAYLKQHILPALICCGAALALTQTTLVQRIENLTLDERTRLRAMLEVTLPADEMAVIGIDEASLHDFGRWPWSREVHSDLLQLLARARPAVVSWDILFTEPTEADEHLAAAIALNRSVVLGTVTAAEEEGGLTLAQAAEANVRLEPLTRVEGDRRLILASEAVAVPAGHLGGVASLGFVNLPPGADGVRRSAPLVVRIGDQVFPSLSLRTLMEYWGARAENVFVRLGDAVTIDTPAAHRRIPIDATGAYAINYRHDLPGFLHFDYSRALITLLNERYGEHKPTPLRAVGGRILLVGQTADGLADMGPTPFGPLTPLVLVHANIIENVLRQDYVRNAPALPIWIGVLVVGVIGLAQFSTRKPIAQAAFALGVPLAFVAAATLVWINGSWIVPVVGPLLGFAALQVFMIGRRMLAELRAKEQITGMFGTYVSPELVSRLVAAGKPPELGGHQKEITAFFSDIQDFSTFSEMLPPDRQVELMNEYLTACTDVVQQEGGTLDKYIGDAMVVMYGAPVPLADHAYRACVAAIRMQETVGQLRAKWQRDGTWPEIVVRLRARVGLNTGSCVIGNMGSRTRFNYTMMGDNVNLGARMESGAKHWGVYTMCTEATRRACEVHGGDRLVFRPLGRIQVKGRTAAVPIYEVAGFRDQFPAGGLECVALFSQGLERYYERDWGRALELFRRSAACELLAPGTAPGVRTNPSLVYIGITEKYRREPPVDWDGIYVMTEK
jgi:adenylate cyclase